MLLRITNRCHSGCSHCMIDGSGPEGEHMSMSTFERALDFIDRCDTKVLLVSGGEPFEHPQVFEMAEMLKSLALERMLMVSFASNGHFVLDDDLHNRVRELGIGVQVTCDPRFYPRLLFKERFQHPGFFFVNGITTIFPCRRTREKGIVSNKTSPLCFNIRSATRQLGFATAVAMLTLQMRICSPSINVDGTVRAGEADTCHQIGTVDSTVAEISDALCSMRCGKCGLGDSLPKKYLDAIGGAA